MGLGSFFRKLFGGEEKATSETSNEINLYENTRESLQNFDYEQQTQIPDSIAEIEKDEDFRTDFYPSDKNDIEEDLND